MRTVVVLLTLAALALAGCGGDDETLPPVAPGAETEPIAPATETEQQGAAGGAAPAPELTECQTVEDAGDGRYEIDGVGTVVVRQDGDRLELESVEPAPGWQHEVDDRGDDEVEVEFFRDGQRLDFEAELEDGRIEAEICPDDD